MLKKSLITMISLILLCVSVIKAQDVNVTGTWEMTMKTPRGERISEVKFVQEGENLTVITLDREGNEVTSEGTVKGNEIQWSSTGTTPRGDRTRTYKGTIEGDIITGTVERGGIGTAEWTATKKEIESQVKTAV